MLIEHVYIQKFGKIHIQQLEGFHLSIFKKCSLSLEEAVVIYIIFKESCWQLEG